MVVSNFAAVIHKGSDPFGERGNRDFLGTGDIDDRLFGIALHQKHQCVGCVVDVQIFANGVSCSPNLDVPGAVHPRFVEPTDQRGDHMAGRKVKAIARTVKISGHHRNEILSVLPAIGLTQLGAGDFRYRIPFVRRLKWSGKQAFLLDGLRGFSRIKA